MQKWREVAAAAQGAMMESMWSLAATSSSTSAEAAHASVSGSAFMLALSDPKMIDRRLGSLYDVEDWADGPDGVAMSMFQREAFLKQLALITAPQQAAKDAVAAAVEATASLTAAVSEAAASTAAERFAQRERVARASEKADVAAAAARRAVLAAQTHVREQRLEAAREKARTDEAAGTAADLDKDKSEKGGNNELGEGEDEGIGAGRELADISWDEDALEACLELSANDAAADGLVKSTTRAEEKVLMKLDPCVWMEQWDPVAALLAEWPTRRASATRTATATAAPPSAGPGEEADDDDVSAISSNAYGGSSPIESPLRNGGRNSRVLATPSPPSFLRKRRPALDSQPAPPLPPQEKHDVVFLQSNAAENQSKSSSRNDDEDCDDDDDDDAREALSARELEWLEARMADADQGPEVVSARLGRHVAVHCEDLISGMRTVQEVDSTLVAASVVAGNGRRLLQKACHNLEHGHLSLVALQRRRDRLASVKAVLRQAALLVEVEAQIEAAATRGAFDSAIVLAVEAQDALGSHAIYDHDENNRDALAGSAEEQSLARLKVLHAMRRRVSGALPGLRRDVDLALWRLVAGRPRRKGETGAESPRPSMAASAPGFHGSDANASSSLGNQRPLGGGDVASLGEEYAAIVRAYMHLDDLRVQAPDGDGGLPGAAGGHFDDDDEEDDDDDGDDSRSSKEESSGDSDATEDMSISMSAAHEVDSPSGDAVFSPYGQGNACVMEDGKDQYGDEEEDELLTISSRHSRGHFQGAAAGGATMYSRSHSGTKRQSQSGSSNTAAVAALAAAERESVASAVGAALAVDGTKPSIAGLGVKLERYFAFQAQRLAQLDARKRLFSPSAAAKEATTIAALPPRSRARSLLPWPARLQAWLQNASGACAAACVAGCCAEMVGLLHRYWLLQHWHRHPFASDAAGARGTVGAEPYSLATDAAAAAQAAAVAAATSNTSADETTGATAAAKQAQEVAYVVGERVEAKDFGEGEEWEVGTVAALEDAGDGRQVPRVIKDGYESAYLWDAVRKLPMTEEELQAKALAEDAATLAAVEAAEADLASDDDDDEDEDESMEADRDRGGGGKSNTEKSISGAIVAAREKARRLLREQKRLAPVAAALRRGRFALWRACEDQVVALLTAMDVTPADDDNGNAHEDSVGAEPAPQDRPRMTPEALAAISATCQLFAHVGRQFCAHSDSTTGGKDFGGLSSHNGGNGFGSGFASPKGGSSNNNSNNGGFEGSRRLEGCLRLRTKLFFAAYHAKQLVRAKELAARDSWERGPHLSLPPTPSPPRASLSRSNRDNRGCSSSRSNRVEGWNTGLSASDVLSTVRVLTAEAPGLSSNSSTGSRTGDGNTSDTNDGRAYQPWACSARQHAAVRRLVASKRSLAQWPRVVERLPAVRALLRRRTLAQDRLWQMGHLKPPASHDASAEVSLVLQGALRELLTATTASCVPTSTAAIDMEKKDNGNNATTSAVAKPVEMFVLGSIHLWGNLFSASSAEDWAKRFADEPSNNNEELPAGATSDGAEEDDDDDDNVEEEGDGDVAPGSDSSSNGNEAMAVRRLERRQFGTAWTVTRPALHVAACAASYSALMLHLPWVAADAHAGLGQLAKLHMYNVLTLFAPPKALRALCLPPKPSRAGTAGSGSEASTGRSTGMGLRSYKRSGATNKEGSDGSGSDHESSSASASNNNASTGQTAASSSEQLLSADARAFADLKRFAMLAAEELSAPGSMSAGGDASTSSGASASAKSRGSGSRGHRSSTNTAAVYTSSTGVRGEPRAPVPRPLIEYPAVVVPVTHEGGLCGPDNLWALRERIAAAQSLIFVLEVLLASQPQLTVLLAAPTSSTISAASPLAAALQHEATHCEQALKELMPVASDIQRFLFRAVGRAVINAHALAKRVAAHPWNEEDGDHDAVSTPALSYVAAVASDAARAWEALCGNGDGSGGAAANSVADRNCWVVPIVARDAVWSEAVQAVMDALVEGFARAGPVSADARSQMADDLQAVQLSLDRVHRARPRRGKVYVDAYLKAFYYGEDDLVRWISQNWEHYQEQHMVALVTSGIGARMRPKQKSGLVAQVHALYDAT